MIRFWQDIKSRAIENIRSIIFGLSDSLVSTTGAITGIAVGSRDRGFVVMSGIVIVAVEAISMAAGEYLSVKSQREEEEEALAEELRQIRRSPEREREELERFYRERGFSDWEIRILLRRIMGSEQRLLEEMAHRELHVPYPPRLRPAYNALYMGLSYLLGGIVPVLPYLFLPLLLAIPASVLSAMLALFLAGALKGRLLGVPPVASGTEMVLISLGAALAGYAIGALASLWIRPSFC